MPDIYTSGQKAPVSGVYQCSRFLCGKRKTVSRGKRLPPCSCGHQEWQVLTATTKPRKKKGKGFLESLWG